MLRLMPGKPAYSLAAPHKPGRNITGVAEPVLSTCPAAVFFPEQRQRHVRSPQLAVHHRPVRSWALFRSDRRRRRIKQRLELVVVEPLGQWPIQSHPASTVEAGVHRPRAQPQTAPDRPLAQTLSKSQAQHLTYLPHRHSLARHLDPPLLGKGSGLPVVEDCQ
jgi:hypothetical protein